jgi:hypothetical protein
MREFNHKRAHREWAFPQWQLLSEAIKVLYMEVQEAYGNTYQLIDLSMPWLEGFPEKFASIPDEELVHAQMVIQALGHWDSKDNHDLDFPRDKHGTHWKFEKLAKQSLIARGWTSPWPATPTDQFMDHKEGTGMDVEEIAKELSSLLSPEFVVCKVDYVNHRLREGVERITSLPRHPFVVGRKHLQNSKSMYLDPRCAPCDYCGHAYDDHISDKVAFISLSRATDSDDFVLTDDEKAKLQSVTEIMDSNKMDGFAFVKGDQVS